MSYRALIAASTKLQEYLNLRSADTIAMSEEWGSLSDMYQEMIFEICLNYIIKVSERNPDSVQDRAPMMREYILRAKEIVGFLRSIGRL